MKHTIDYKELREVLESQVRDSDYIKALDFHIHKPDDIPFINRLIKKGKGVFDSLIKDLNTDTELQQHIDSGVVDGVVERIVELISKYEGTDIPAPSDELDDWWGDFNQTIRYLTWTFKTYKTYR